MPAQTEHTLTTPEALLADLARARKRGYATDDGEQEVGVRCVAVPVDGAPASLAISVSGPSARVTTARVTDIAPILREVVAELAEHLHGAGNR